jgi:N-acyl-D-amino-acid deacylase
MDVYPYVAGSTVLREDLVDGVIDVLLTWSDPHPEMTGRYSSPTSRRMGRRPSRRRACACSPAAPATSRCARTTSSA